MNLNKIDTYLVGLMLIFLGTTDANAAQRLARYFSQKMGAPVTADDALELATSHTLQRETKEVQINGALLTPSEFIEARKADPVKPLEALVAEFVAEKERQEKEEAQPRVEEKDHLREDEVKVIAEIAAVEKAHKEREAALRKTEVEDERQRLKAQREVEERQKQEVGRRKIEAEENGFVEAIRKGTVEEVQKARLAAERTLRATIEEEARMKIDAERLKTVEVLKSAAKEAEAARVAEEERTKAAVDEGGVKRPRIAMLETDHEDRKEAKVARKASKAHSISRNPDESSHKESRVSGIIRTTSRKPSLKDLSVSLPVNEEDSQISYSEASEKDIEQVIPPKKSTGALNTQGRKEQLEVILKAYQDADDGKLTGFYQVFSKPDTQGTIYGWTIDPLLNQVVAHFQIVSKRKNGHGVRKGIPDMWRQEPTTSDESPTESPENVDESEEEETLEEGSSGEEASSSVSSLEMTDD